jgi:hypothetical protein
MGQMTKVFVSSTYDDLVGYRDVVQKVIRQAGAVAVGMEDFGARDQRPLSECLAVVEESDVFVGIYAHRYGFIPDGLQISITEAEYQHAISTSLPVFAYIIDDDYPWPPKYVDQGESAKKLSRFKHLLRDNHIVKKFEEDWQLASFVMADLNRHSLREGLSDARTESIKIKIDGVSGKAFTGKTKDSFVPRKTKNMTTPEVRRPSNPDEWNNDRYSIYNKNKDLFLHYDLEASNVTGQKYDVTIYLIRQSAPKVGRQRDDLRDVERVEFFFGPHWGNKVYTVENVDGRIGVLISAYGEFLAYCKVYLKGDPCPVEVHQFIRFPDATQGGNEGGSEGGAEGGDAGDTGDHGAGEFGGEGGGEAGGEAG